MAAGRVLLATHDGHPGALRPLRQPAQAGFEPSALRHPSVEHTPLVIVETVPVRPPAELFPQKQVPDTGGVQVSLQGLPIELRVEARERRGPHIGHRLHRLSSQEFHEDLDRMGRVPDGQKIRTAHAIRISLVHAASCSAGPPTVIPSLRPDPVRGILVPLVAGVRDSPQGCFDVVPPTLIIQTASDQLGDESTPTPLLRSPVECRDQFVIQVKV